MQWNRQDSSYSQQSQQQRPQGQVRLAYNWQKLRIFYIQFPFIFHLAIRYINVYLRIAMCPHQLENSLMLMITNTAILTLVVQILNLIS